MPYERLSDANPAILGIEPPVTLAQANLIASWADEIERGEADVESPWAVAIANFKKAYHIEGGDRWVKNKPATKEASLTARIRHVESAWRAKYATGGPYGPEPGWPEEVFEDKVTVSTPKGLMAYPYTMQEDGTVEFGEPMQIKAHEGDAEVPEAVQGALARLFENLNGFVTEAMQKLKGNDGKADVTGPDRREAAREAQEKDIGEFAGKGVFLPVVKGRDGKDWWVGFSGTAFEDLEKEIISRKAIDFGIAYGDKTGERGDLRLFHLPGSRVGSCEVQLREGCFLIEAGRWDETDVASRTKQAGPESQYQH